MVIDLIRGDTLSFGFEVENIDDIAAAYFNVKKSAADTAPIIQKALYDGIDNAGGGFYRVRVKPEETSQLEAGIYRFGLEIHKNGDVFTVLSGLLNVDYPTGGNI